MHALARSVGIAVVVGMATAPAQGQERDRATRMYLDAVAGYFRQPPTEIAILADWGFPVEEIPPILFVAARAEVSPDAVVALRRSGTSWGDLLRRYGIGVGDLHLPMPDHAPTGSLESAYAIFRTTPRSEWSTAEISDEAIVTLVNVAVVAAASNTPVSDVVALTASTPSFVEILDRLRR